MNEREKTKTRPTVFSPDIPLRRGKKASDSDALFIFEQRIPLPLAHCQATTVSEYFLFWKKKDRNNVGGSVPHTCTQVDGVESFRGRHRFWRARKRWWRPFKQRHHTAPRQRFVASKNDVRLFRDGEAIIPLFVLTRDRFIHRIVRTTRRDEKKNKRRNQKVGKPRRDVENPRRRQFRQECRRHALSRLWRRHASGWRLPEAE